MYRKYNRNRRDGNSYRKPRANIAAEAYGDNSYSAPSKELYGDNSATLQHKAFRDLSNIGVIDIKADPNAEMSYGAFPYTIIGATNPVLDAKYPGYQNISGNSITEIQNNTTSSLLMNTFDCGCIVKNINYLYLTVKPTPTFKNLAVTAEMMKSVEQAVSFGFSTMLTQLAFTSDQYTTEIPVPSSMEGKKVVGYFGALIHYQTVLQAIATPISKYIELRSLEKEMMRMSFRTEAPLLTEIFGLFKKASFVSIVNTVGTVLLNEYFDKNWYTQMNTLLCVPSRKTKGMVDPLLTLIGIHQIPRLTITTAQGTNPYYDSNNLSCPEAAVTLDPETFKFAQGKLSLQQIITNICKLLNPAYIFRFIRLMNHNALPDDAIKTTSAYAEAVKTLMQYVSILAAQFSTNVSNIRTFLDKMSQSNMMYWTKGVSFFVDKVEQLEPHYNVLLNDVFQGSYSGSNEVVFDNQTKRWRAWSLWNKYTGIPEFDKMSGGCFLTFGLRKISKTASDNVTTVGEETSAGLIPILFSGCSSNLIVTRLGATLDLSSVDYCEDDFNNDCTFKRLNPVGNLSASIKLPTCETKITDLTSRASFSSAAVLLLGNTFGYGEVIYDDGHEVKPSIAKILDPDYVSFLDLEIEDVSNQMIVFARNYSPFRVDTPDGKRTIGFSSN